MYVVSLRIPDVEMNVVHILVVPESAQRHSNDSFKPEYNVDSEIHTYE